MAKEQLRIFTSNQLRGYRGQNDALIYLSIKGLVYDVSQSRHLYGPGMNVDGPYQMFAGKEIARALALFSLTEKDCTGDLSQLDEAQLSDLEEWIAKFKKQYPIVGRVSEPFWQKIFKSLF